MRAAAVRKLGATPDYTRDVLAMLTDLEAWVVLIAATPTVDDDHRARARQCPALLATWRASMLTNPTPRATYTARRQCVELTGFFRRHIMAIAATEMTAGRPVPRASLLRESMRCRKFKFTDPKPTPAPLAGKAP